MATLAAERLFMKHILLFITALALYSGTLSAQTQLADQLPGTLFAYPQAPDTCSTLESRCNYIITHFWDNYNISKPIADMQAFETTFRDFVGFFMYAHRNVVMVTVRDFVNKAQSNTSNLQKLGEVAERALYGPTAEYWSDEVYVAFAKPLASSKNLPKDVREHYAQQLAAMNAVQTGSALDFEYIGTDGAKHRVSDFPEGTTMIVLFLDDSASSSIGRLRLSTDVLLNSLLDEGKAALLCVCLNKYSINWAATAAGYASNWTVGCGENLSTQLDLRVLPCCYLLDGEHKVLSKALSVDALLSSLNPNY